MGRAIIAIVLGAALFGSAVWYFDLLDLNRDSAVAVEQAVRVRPEAELGDFLYPPQAFPPYRIPERGTADPIELHGVMNPLEQEDVPGPRDGRVLFIGIPVEDNVAAAAGSAAFLTEPYYCADFKLGLKDVPKFYRRLYEGDSAETSQVLGMADPARALLDVVEKAAKIGVAKADVKASFAAEKEGYERYIRAKRLFESGNMSKEDYGGAVLTKDKLIYERESKEEALEIAKNDKVKAETELVNQDIRAKLPYKHITIKSIARPNGLIKQLEPTVMTVQSLERLQAEALVDEQYFTRLKQRKAKDITATIVPSILEDPLFEIPAHNAAVTAVAVAKDMKIVSGSDDKTVCVWSPQLLAHLRHFELDSEVKAIACTPVGAEKNLCVAGCKDGSLHLVNLDDTDPTHGVLIKKAHGHGQATEITSLAFSADGKFFASGALDGSIRVWATWRLDNESKDEYAAELYALDPEHGVAQCHGDAVTSLHFTPQCRLVSAGLDNTLRVWKLKKNGAVADGIPLKDRDGHVTQLGVSHDGKWMLFDKGRILKWYSIKDHRLVHNLKAPSGGNAFDVLAIFSPDNSLLLTAGAPEGLLQLWRAPDYESRGYEVRQFGTRDRQPVTCAAFSPNAGKAGHSYAVSGSGGKIFVWSIPTPAEVKDHRVEGVPIRLGADNLEYGTRQGRLTIHVANPPSERYPNGRFEAGRPVTIVID
jgi:WD40 repeat protein